MVWIGMLGLERLGYIWIVTGMLISLNRIGQVWIGLDKFLDLPIFPFPVSKNYLPRVTWNIISVH